MNLGHKQMPRPMASSQHNYHHRQNQHHLNSNRFSMPSYQDSQVGWASRTTQGLDIYGWPSPQSPSSHSKNWSTGYTPTPTSPTETDSSGSWTPQSSPKSAYYLDRGDGKVTRLVPADQLPLMNEIPRFENKSHGMEVLPALSAISHVGMTDRLQTVTFKETTSPTLHQKRQKPGKHDKEYCDKWVHEGICAFTQQGCRYKHEMPYDKATQQSLGLFHGLPTWWKKRQAEVHRQQESKTATKRHTLSGPYQFETMALTERSFDGRKARSPPATDSLWSRRGSSWPEVTTNVKPVANRADFTLSSFPPRCPYGVIEPPAAHQH